MRYVALCEGQAPFIVLQMHRSFYFSSFYLVGIVKSQPSSLPGAKRLLFADTNRHSCLRKENEGGKKSELCQRKANSMSDRQPGPVFSPTA